MRKRKTWKQVISVLLAITMVFTMCDWNSNKQVEASSSNDIVEDFEVDSTDSLKGYTWGGATELVNDAHGGEKALKVSISGGNNVYEYNISALAGKEVTITAYMKAATADLTAVATVKYTESEETKYGWAVNTNTKADEWVELSGTYTVPETATSIFFQCSPAADEFLIDDISITEVVNETEPDPASENDIVEDFEVDSTDSLKGYTWGGAKELVDDAHTGNKALKLSIKDGNNVYAYDISALAGKEVTIKAYIKASVDDLTAVAVATLTEGDNKYPWVVNTTTKANEWVELSTTYTVPETATSIFFQCSPAQDEFLIDDISIKEVVATSDKPSIVENFNDYSDVSSKKGTTMGGPTLALTEHGYEGTKALAVTDRTSNYFGYSYDLKKYAGNTIALSAKVSTFEAAAEDSNSFSATLCVKTGDASTYNGVANTTIVGSEFTTLSTDSYAVPADGDSYTLYFETTANVSYIIDDISITVVGDYVDPSADEESPYVDYSGYAVLKDLYQDYFKLGVACEALSHWGGYNQLSEIGNTYKEGLIKKEFNSITFGNELKPDSNMGYKSEEATDTNLPFVIDSSAVEMLDWAKKNGIGVRGHVLVWHSQTPDAVFCKDYTPVYVDPTATNKVLDQSCLVDRDTMLARMKSYIDSTMKYMYAKGYAETIYAWDVVNEAIEVGTNEYDLRNSYYYQTIGPDFIYYAFKYTRDAVNTYSKAYASIYGVDANDQDQLATIQPKLFYNDYNEYVASKRDAIIHALTAEINGHSIVGEGLIDGIGMQAHVQDTTSVETFMTALNLFDAVVDEVQITELDVTTTGTDANAEYYQAVFYNDLFKALIEAVNGGANLTSVTIWGLTDDNSWRKDECPLLFNGDLSQKLAFNGVAYAVTGESLGEPTYIARDFSFRFADFEADGEEATTPAEEGFTARGDAALEIQSDVVCAGKASMLVTGRTASWHGVSFDVSDFIGQTIAVSAWVKSDSSAVRLSADLGNAWPNIAQAVTSSGEWVQITGTYKVPSDLQEVTLYFETGDLNDIYVDNVKVKLVGLEEGFEEAENIASARGAGHMPVVSVVTTESHTGDGHSFYVKRAEQDANMKFAVTPYIAKTVNVSAYVKTTDSKIYLGLDGDTPVECAVVDTIPGEWTRISATLTIPEALSSAAMYIETDGNADFYVDDIFVEYAEYRDDVEGALNFTTRWGGAGSISQVEDGEGNKAACLTDREGTYYGVAFDVTKYLGQEVKVSVDVKTEDSTISLSGDINNVWPNYAKVESISGQYVTVDAIVALPSDLEKLNLYIETSGTSDIYVDNLSITPYPISEEYRVVFDTNGFVAAPSSQLVYVGTTITEPSDEELAGCVVEGWYKDSEYTQAWNFNTDSVMNHMTLYAKFSNELVFTDSDAFNLPESVVGTAITPIDVANAVTGGALSYTFSATGLPAGIAISTSGLISGTPTAVSASGTAILYVTDADNKQASITIEYGAVKSATPVEPGKAELVFTDSDAFNLPESVVGTAITPIDVANAVTGGALSYTFSATGLPAGIAISTSGLISGTPTAVSESGTAILYVTDADNKQASITIEYGAIKAATPVDPVDPVNPVNPTPSVDDNVVIQDPSQNLYTDWSDLNHVLNSIDPEEKNVEFKMYVTGNNTVSVDTLNAIAGKNITLTIVDQNGLAWSFEGADLDTESIEKVNLNATVKTVNDASELSDQLSKDTACMQISMKSKNEFGTDVAVSVDVSSMVNKDEKTKKLYAAIYTIDTVTNELILVSVSNIDKDGNAKFNMNKGSDYLVVVDDKLIISRSLLNQVTVEKKGNGINRTKLIRKDKEKRTSQFVVTLPSAIQQMVDNKIGNVQIKYVSDNTKAVMISRTGKMKAKGKGSAIITAIITVGDVSTTVDMKVVCK